MACSLRWGSVRAHIGELSASSDDPNAHESYLRYVFGTYAGPSGRLTSSGWRKSDTHVLRLAPQVHARTHM